MRLRGKLLIPIGMGVSGMLLVQGWTLWQQREEALAQIATARQYERAVTETLHAELALKSQVHEWKNILLRGHDAGDFAAYHGKFVAREREVRERLHDVAGSAGEQGPDIQRFLTEHEALGRRYREALDTLVSGTTGSVERADDHVRGADRGPTERLHAISVGLHRQSLEQQARQRQHADTTTWTLLGVSLTLGLLLTSVMWAGIRTFIANPAERTARFARDIAAGRPPEPWLPPGDEFGEVIVSLRELRESLLRERAHLDARDQDLAAARREVAASARARDVFMATITHELRTPLNGVLGALELLRSTPLDPEQSELTRAAFDSGRKLSAMVEELLDITDASGGMLALRDTRFEIGACLTEAVEHHRRAAAQKGIALTFQATGGPREVCGDAERLGQVVQELVENALDATDRGRVDVVARIVNEGHRVRLRVDVVDTGKGIDPARREELFQAFPAERGPYDREKPGPGLGLAWCRQVVRSMGGDLDLEPQTGGGSRFWFEVQLQDPNFQAGPADAGTMTHLSVPSQSGARVLVLDPDPDRGRRMWIDLNATGTTAKLANDLMTATELLAQEPVELVIARWREEEAEVGCDALRSAADAAGRLPALVILIPPLAPKEPWLFAGWDDVIAAEFRSSDLGNLLERWLPKRAA